MSVTIITLIIPMFVAVVAVSSTVEVQSSGRLALVGVLHPGSQPLGLLEAFRDGLRELGYVEGRTVKLEWRFADGQSKRLPQLARELVNLKVDAILAITTEAAQAARSTSGTIPIIIARVTDPVGSGLVASLARPGGNVTGLSAMTGELSAKRLQLLKEALLQARRVAVIWNSGNPGPASVVRELENATPHFGLTLQALPARSDSDLPGVFEAIA